MYREVMDDHQDQRSTTDRICLIVDDEPSIRAYLRAILQRERIQSLEADNAAQALRIVQKLGGRLDLIVCDIKMPGEMDGIDLAYSVRHSFPAVPVVLISGYGDVESVKHAAANFEFIQKPFVPETILMAVKRVVGSLDANAYQTPIADEDVL
jgi:DNA-binding NtrC family response regulator